jgi:pyridoxine 5'-phosphate synthase PdxJ
MTFPAFWKKLEKSLNIIEGLREETETVGSFLDAPSSVTTTLAPADRAGVTDERGLDLTEGTQT